MTSSQHATQSTGRSACAEPVDRPAIPLGQRILILASCMVAVAAYFTSILIASTVLPQMQGTFSATADEISWSITFNILATAIAMPMTGWLTARIGRRHLIVWATAIFTVSTMMCGLATSLEQLIFWRVRAQAVARELGFVKF